MSDYTPPTLVIPTPGGSAGDGSMSGALTVQAGVSSDTVETLLKAGSDGKEVLGYQSTNHFLRFNGIGNAGFDSFGNLGIFGYNSVFKNVGTVGYGLSPIYGKDQRTGLTAADASAKTLYTTTAADQVYEVAARIFGTGGTITSGIYTVGWTEGGTSRTATVSITATGTLSSSLFLLQPDSGTAITGELTTLSGTSPVVNVAAVVKEDV